MVQGILGCCDKAGLTDVLVSLKCVGEGQHNRGPPRTGGCGSTCVSLFSKKSWYQIEERINSMHWVCFGNLKQLAEDCFLQILTWYGTTNHWSP